jgi:hypothetical protein
VQAIALIGFVGFVGVSLSVGLRLLLLAGRTRQVPEAAIGGALFAGGLGYALFILAFALQVVPAALLAPAHGLAVLALEVGVVALSFGVWRLFRPRQRWAAAAVALVAILMALHLPLSLAGFDPSGRRSDPVFWLFNVVGGSAYLWSSFESFRYHALMRRRARLGLVDGELVNRFLLWGFAGGSAFLLFAFGMANRLTDGGLASLSMVGQPLAGLVSGACIWLAFFPPAAYVRFVARGTA